MADPDQSEGIVERLSRQGEEALGKVAEELIANPVINGAIARALEAREKAVLAQEAAMGALNIPSAADVERVTRRLRSLSQRLEGIEDAIDRLEERLAAASARSGDERLAAIEERLDEIARDLGALRESVAPSEAAVPQAQERLTVDRLGRAGSAAPTGNLARWPSDQASRASYPKRSATPSSARSTRRSAPPAAAVRPRRGRSTTWRARSTSCAAAPRIGSAAAVDRWPRRSRAAGSPPTTTSAS